MVIFIGLITVIINQLKKNGKGIEYYENGKKNYDGNYVDDEYEGDGTFYFENGVFIKGNFKNGKKEGNGIIFDSNYYKKKEGTFEDDKLISENNDQNSDKENEFENEDRDYDNKNDSKSKEKKEEYFDKNNIDSNYSQKFEEKKNNNKGKTNSEVNFNSNNSIFNIFSKDFKSKICDAFYPLANFFNCSFIR